ncbi:putative membrane protein [Babesia divergens]|uniref:Membrane protein n=1 Tax=Babesia divergens TaxID=32595 RepID=A0AAD9GE91_BABDI|nr:putative membrane protein [Babesia divergens]
MEYYCDSNSLFTLLKVPKFVAEQWRNTENQGLLGSYRKNKNGILEEFLIQCEGKQRRFLCRSHQLSCPTAVQIKDANMSIESMGKFKACLTMYPTLDTSYKSKIKDRHVVANLRKERGTAHEDRDTGTHDRSATLFKYYNPHPESVVSMVTDTEADPTERKKQETPYLRSKMKVQKREPMDMDELKMSVCKIFETDEGREGLQFKRICQLINQPPANVKVAIDEITEQRKRPSDHKMAYFLRNHFNHEEKKSILSDNTNP